MDGPAAVGVWSTGGGVRRSVFVAERGTCGKGGKRVWVDVLRAGNTMGDDEVVMLADTARTRRQLTGLEIVGKCSGADMPTTCFFCLCILSAVSVGVCLLCSLYLYRLSKCFNV